MLGYAPVLKFLTYYAQYYVHVKDLCFKFDCFITVYLKFYTLQLYNIIVNVLLEYIDLQTYFQSSTSYYAGIMLDAFSYLLCSRLYMLA